MEGTLVPDDFPNCELEHELSRSGPRANYSEFRRSFKFGKFTYCYRCGVPQDRNRNGEAPMCHASYNFAQKKPCEFEHLVFRAAFCIWQKKELRCEMVAELGVASPIGTQGGFTQWAIAEEREDGKYHNCLEAFLWFCGRIERWNRKYFM